MIDQYINMLIKSNYLQYHLINNLSNNLIIYYDHVANAFVSAKWYKNCNFVRDF